MLYSPKWEKPSVAGLAAWLETQPPETKYDFANSSSCLVAQYLRAIGKENCDLLSWEIDQVIGPGTSKIALGKTDIEQTFGAALKRARGVLKIQQVEVANVI